MATNYWISSSSTDGSVAGNWSLNHTPADTEDVVLTNNAIDIASGLDMSDIALTSLTIDQSYTGRIGTATAYWIIGAGVVSIGQNVTAGTTPSGSTRIMLDLRDDATTAAAVTVHNSATTATESNLPPIRLLTPAGSTLTVRKGFVGVAVTVPGETSTVVTLNQSYVSNQSSDAKVVLGPGVTATTLTMTGGTATLQSAATTVTQNAGTLTVSTTGTVGTFNQRGGTATTLSTCPITTLNMYGGTLNSNSTGTITTANVYGGTLDLTGTNAARTITTLNLYATYADAAINYDPAVVTITNKVAPGNPVLLKATAY